MNTAVSPIQYLDKALNGLHDLGLLPEQGGEEAPIIALLKRIADLDEERVVAITRTLSQASLFNEVVREQVQAMDIGTRYEDIVDAFNSIRDDARKMVDQIDDGKLDTFERISNVWMKVTRGDIASRFDDIKDTYLEVTEATQDQIQREQTILEAYQDFRGALKQSEVMALELLEKAGAKLEAAKGEVNAAMKTVEAYQGGEAVERARLEMARDEKVRALQNEEKRYQIGKDQWVHQFDVAKLTPIERPEDVDTEKWVGREPHRAAVGGHDAPVSGHFARSAQVQHRGLDRRPDAAGDRAGCFGREGFRRSSKKQARE